MKAKLTSAVALAAAIGLFSVNASAATWDENADNFVAEYKSAGFTNKMFLNSLLVATEGGFGYYLTESKVQ
jgi:hypothetical protein